MKKKYIEQLAHLKETILRMGGLAEQMVHRAVQALVERRPEMLADVRNMEAQVNQLNIEIDDQCVQLIALQQPAGPDVRFVSAAMKINANLERIGDQAINITEQAESLLSVPPLKPLIDIPRMAEIAKEMLKDSLDAFVNGDAEQARVTIARDDLVDNLKDQIFRELLTYMMGDARTIPRAMDLILISRHLERIADHATNICEDVIFVIKGQDVRHQFPVA